MNPGRPVPERPLEAQFDTADRIDDVAKATEDDRDVMMGTDTGEPLDGLDEA